MDSIEVFPLKPDVARCIGAAELPGFGLMRWRKRLELRYRRKCNRPGDITEMDESGYDTYEMHVSGNPVNVGAVREVARWNDLTAAVNGDVVPSTASLEFDGPLVFLHVEIRMNALYPPSFAF